MASMAAVAKNERRKQTVAQHAATRAALKRTIASAKASPAEKEATRAALRRLPRDANPNRVRNRCLVTGRPRAVYRNFGPSRIALRELAQRITCMMDAAGEPARVLGSIQLFATEVVPLVERRTAATLAGAATP